jgi:hypothetical protein
MNSAFAPEIGPRRRPACLSGHGHRQVLFSGSSILVINAVGAFDEHHNRGDAGADDFGGVRRGPKGRVKVSRRSRQAEPIADNS